MEPSTPPADQPACAVCSGAIDAQDEYIQASCSKCKGGCFHIDCVTPLMAKIHHDSTSSKERARRLIQTRPHYYMAEQKMRCPCSQECGGKIIDAKMIKPIRQPPAPPPGLPPPPHSQKAKKKAKQQQQAAPQPPQPQAAKRRQPAAAAGMHTPPHTTAASAATTPSPATSAAAVRDQQRAAVEATRGLVAPDYAQHSASYRRGRGSEGNLLQTVRVKFPPGQRPVELQMCKDWADCGECYTHRCPRCHGEEELNEREQMWLARQEAMKREKRQQELERHERAKEEQEKQSVWLNQVLAREAERLEHEEGYLDMGDACLQLMKEHKRKQCIEGLVDMGFDTSTAAAAADATGADVSVAAGQLMEGGLVFGSKPISVTGEAQDLLAFAASLGLDVKAVEVALVLAGGNWDQARSTLAQQAEQAAVSDSAAQAATAAAAAAAASSREDADLAAALAASRADTGVPRSAAQQAEAAAREEAELAAALQASTSSAATAYNTARQAAAAAAAAREEAELAAAIEASKADAARHERWQQQQQYSLPWTVPTAASGSSATIAGWQAMQQQEQQHHKPQQQYNVASSSAGGTSGMWYDASAKQSMPEYRGGWDAGPAAVAAVSGRNSAASSSGAAPAAADLWQQQPGQQPRSSSSMSTAGMTPAPATPAAAAADSWGSHPASLANLTPGPPAHVQLAAVFPHSTQQAAATSDLAAAVAAAQPVADALPPQNTASWALQLQKHQVVQAGLHPQAHQHPAAPASAVHPAQQAQQQGGQHTGSAELDELMQLLGLGA